MVRSTYIRYDQSGGAKIKVFLVLLILLAGAAGGWYFFMRKDTPQKTAKEEKDAIPCKSQDKTLCRFITSWEAPKAYRFTVEETTSGATETSVFEYDLGEPAKIHATLANGQETITIGNTLYTKSGSVWRKQTIGSAPARSNTNTAIDETSVQDVAPIKPNHYKAVGEEECGSRTCYKYQVFDPDSSGTKQFIWFDDADFKLRRLRFESGRTISDQSFEYVKVDISEPSPIQATR